MGHTPQSLLHSGGYRKILQTCPNLAGQISFNFRSGIILVSSFFRSGIILVNSTFRSGIILLGTSFLFASFFCKSACFQPGFGADQDDLPKPG